MDNSHAEPPVQQPYKSHEPALRGVAADALPAQDQVEPEGRAGDERGEEHQHQGGGVEERLQRGDLAGDLERRELGQGACAGRSPATRHRFVGGGGAVYW